MEQQSLVFAAPKDGDVPAPASGHSAGQAAAPPPAVLTVSECTQQLKAHLESRFLDVWVVGEVSRFVPSSSGHWYFTLKDDQSVMNIVVFRGINQRFPFQLKDGMEVICHGRIDVYPKRGAYQLLADKLEPKGTGALQLAFEQLKARLDKEGLFAKQHKKPLPKFPRRVGVVTSPTGAAVRDILNVLRRRMPGVEIVVAPAKVQGAGAAQEIAQAVALLDAEGSCDVLIVGRGGGSVEDLWAFNEEVVARALFACRTPVVSAVGHEIDFTIADFVADLRAPTPSAAAELVVPDRAELLAGLRQARERMAGGLRRWWQLRAQRLADLRGRLRPAGLRFDHAALQIDHCLERLRHSMEAGLRAHEARLRGLAGELQHLSPLAVLAKGYAVVADASGRAIRCVADARAAAHLQVRFADGTVTATVKEHP